MSDVPGLDVDPPEDELDPEDEPETEPETEPEDKPDDETAKWRKRAESRERRLRDAQKELAALRARDAGDSTPDPVLVANGRLIRAEARAQLAAVGVVDRDDQRAALATLNLSDIDVDEMGEVDADALEERIADLRRVFGGKGAAPAKRSPRVDTRDKGGKDNGAAAVSPDAARFKRILGQR